MDTPKVPKREFDAVLSRLLATPPLPMADISPKKRKAKRPEKKRG